MRPYGLGILPNSKIFFYTPKEADKDIFLYPRCVGLYECGNNYYVNRNSYNSFLLLYVLEGSAYIKVDGEEQTIKSNRFALLDCYKPHVYGSHSGCRLMWVHYDGPMAREYYEYICSHQKGNGLTVSDSAAAYRNLAKLYEVLAEKIPIEPADMSKYLLNTLTEFMKSPKEDRKDNISDIERARLFINENFDKQISLEEIAAQANLSIYYFTRRFKRAYGHTPHEYLINIRLNTACFYLASSSAQIKEIAFSCGFTNESNFCTSFKKNIGCTPAEYRDYHRKQGE